MQESIIQERLAVYLHLLQQWAPRLNLIARSTIPHIVERHFYDSAQLIPFLRKDATVVDIGSGAGFPGMVLAMHGYSVTLLESDEKKCVFLEHVSRETNTPVTVVCDRAENYNAHKRVDYVTARAVAPLSKLVELACNFVSDGHTIGLFLKGKSAPQEAAFLQVNCDLVPSQFSAESYIARIRF